MRITHLLLFSLLLVSINTYTQSNLYHPASVSEKIELKGGDLYLSIDNKHFFINNEYSQPVVKGYTLPGQEVNPLLKYLSSNGVLQLELGLRAKHFFGHEQGIFTSPLFTAQVNLSPTTQFVLGAIRGDLYHMTSDLIFQHEYRFTNKPEYGLLDPYINKPEYSMPSRQFSSPEYGVQVRHDSKRLWLDFWLNWESYTEHGDTIPEQFTTGLSMRAPIHISTTGWKLTSVIQTTIVHVGGEISDFEESGRSDMNNLLGIEIEKSSNSFFNLWGVYGHFLHYKELKSEGNNVLPSGNGIDTGIYFQKQNHHLKASWWTGKKYLSLRGNPIYQSVSYHDREQLFPNRDLISAKYLFKKDLSKDILFSLMVEGFYDLNLKNLDYSYGIQLLYTPQFFLKNIKPTF